jgi:hypothetical protein
MRQRSLNKPESVWMPSEKEIPKKAEANSG